MNKQLLLLPLLMSLVSAPLYARDHNGHGGFHDKARVVGVTPIYETVETPAESRECWTEEVQGVRNGNSGTGMVVGSIIGGVIGHQIGRGNERKIATVAGTVIGAAVGRDADRQARNEPYTTTEQHCQVRTEYVQEERLLGYQVTYRYHGELFTTEMDRHPGKFVPVRVHVSALD